MRHWKCGALVLVCALGMGACSQIDNSARIDSHKKLAGELESNRLYRAAVAEYEKVLEYPDLDEKHRANICYLIARISYEDIRDFEQAAAYYLRAREYDPEGSFVQEASRNLVASLEKLGNVVDAKRQLDKAANVDSGPASDSDVVVAKIGDRSIWLSEINRQIAGLDPNVQKELLSAAGKREFVHQYVGVELLYQAAMRENYLSDPEIQAARERLTRQLLVNKYVMNNVIPKIKTDTLDVRNFYTANKDTRYDGKPYDSVRAQVFLDYQNQKAESAYDDYIRNLAQAERVEVFDKNVR